MGFLVLRALWHAGVHQSVVDAGDAERQHVGVHEPWGFLPRWALRQAITNSKRYRGRPLWNSARGSETPLRHWLWWCWQLGASGEPKHRIIFFHAHGLTEEALRSSNASNGLKLWFHGFHVHRGNFSCKCFTC